MTHAKEVITASWDGSVAIISNSTGSIWSKTGFHNNDNWSFTQGVTAAKDVALVGGGVMYYIASNGDVFRTSNYTGKGTNVGRNANGSASKDGTVAVLSSDGSVSLKVFEDDQDVWFRLRGLVGAVDIAVANISIIYITDASNEILRVNF